MATALLLPGNMCGPDLWRADPSLVGILEARGYGTADVDTASDDRIGAMASRALEVAEGDLLLIGFSMGAILALEIFRQAPNRVTGLVLLDLNASADLPERAAVRPAQQKAVRSGDLERLVIEELKPRYFAASNANERAIRDWVLDMARALGPEVFVRQSEALRTRPDLRSVLPTIAVSVFLGVGAEDALCPPEWHLGWQRLIPRARLTVFEGAGHMLPLEAPRALCAALAAWLDEVGL